MEFYRRQKNKKLKEAHTATKVVLCLLCVTMVLLFSSITLVSALDFDNVKNYDSDSKKATIVNSFGLGDTIAEATLLTPQTVWVTPGKDVKVAEIQIEVFGDDYTNALKDMKFYDAQDMLEQKERIFEYKVKVESGTELIDDYKWTCDEATLLVNGSENINCYNKLIGTKEATTYTWNKLGTKDLAPGVHVIGIFTDVEPGEYTEWIPTMFGMEINEWADFVGATLEAHWNGNLDNDKTNWDTFNEMGGNTFNTSDVAFNIVGAGTKIAWSGVNRSCNILAFLYAEASEKPTGAILSSGKSGVSLYNSTATWINISMSDYTLAADTNYSIVFGHDCGTNATDYLQWRYANAGSYDGGQMFLSTDNGSSYTTYTTLDGMFEIWNGESLIAPTVNQTFPADGQQFSTTDSNVLFNCTSTDLNGVVNLTLAINDVANITITNSTAGENLTIQTNLNFSKGNYNWSCFASDADNQEGTTTNKSFEIYDLLTVSEVYNTTSWQTDRESFSVNITGNGLPITATLVYAGTNYTATKIGDNTNMEFSYTHDISATSSGNQTFYWEINQNGALSNTTHHNQSINGTFFNICNASLSNQYLNITFKDEDDSAWLNASIPASTWYYYLINPAVNKSFTYSNTTGSLTYLFCASPENRTLNVVPYIQYKQDPLYPQRIWDPGVKSYSNTTIHQTLQLLSTTDGQYVTFQVVNSAEQVLEGVVVNATRVIGGETVIVGAGTTGADGGVTFWLNPDFSHTFNFLGAGYDLYTTTLTPTQTSYTITLSSGIASTSNDCRLGIDYTVEPGNSTLTNNTAYDFKFNLNSSYWTVESFGFVLKNSTGILDSTSASTNGGTVTVNANTNNNSEIQMQYFFIINGTECTNSTKLWHVISDAGTEWSLLVFFNDLKSYTDNTDGGNGIFGLDTFGLAIIIFITMFMFIGVMSYKFGLASPAAISALIFAVVLFFDTGLNLIEQFNPVTAVPHFPTIFVGFIMVGLILKEVYR